ncbi:hypothetical protein KSS87_022613, partial [Heliosperma pusillum]
QSAKDNVQVQHYNSNINFQITLFVHQQLRSVEGLTLPKPSKFHLYPL